MYNPYKARVVDLSCRWPWVDLSKTLRPLSKKRIFNLIYSPLGSVHLSSKTLGYRHGAIDILPLIFHWFPRIGQLDCWEEPSVSALLQGTNWHCRPSDLRGLPLELQAATARLCAETPLCCVRLGNGMVAKIFTPSSSANKSLYFFVLFPDLCSIFFHVSVHTSCV